MSRTYLAVVRVNVPPYSPPRCCPYGKSVSGSAGKYSLPVVFDMVA